MIIFVLVLALICLSGAKCRHDLCDDYLDKDQCTSIKGICIILVFIRHFGEYGVIGSNVVDELWMNLDCLLGQLIVVPFLFYSGFGVMESLKRYGREYLLLMPRKRVLNTMINFAIAVTIYAILALCMGKPYSWKDYVFALMAWQSVGNSVWYIFIIVWCYIIFYVCGVIEQSLKKMVWLNFACLTLFMVIMSYLKDWWWYNTLLLFATGCVYSIYRHDLEVVIKQYYWRIFSLTLFTFLSINFVRLNARGLVFNMQSILFMFILLFINMKFKIQQKVVQWCGVNLFAIYIYQRIPMILLESYCPALMRGKLVYLGFIICLVGTIVIAMAYKVWRVDISKWSLNRE